MKKILVIAIIIAALGSASVLGSAVSAPALWKHLALDGKSVHAIAVSPNFKGDGTVFAASSDGVYRSTDYGSAWQRVAISPTRTSAYAVVASPDYKADKTVIATTWGWGKGSVIKSTDGGGSWTTISSTGFQVLAISPSYETDKTLFAASSTASSNSYEKSDYIYRSTDGGKTWTSARFYVPEATVQSLAISPSYATDKTVYAGTSAGVVKSTDGGQTWSRIAALNDRFIGTLAVVENSDAITTIFAGTEATTENAVIHKSTNGGKTWTQHNAGLISDSISAIAVSPNYAVDNTLFAGTFGHGIYKSSDGGASWVDASSGLTDNFVYDGALVVAPDYAQSGTVFAGTYGAGVFSTTEKELPASTTTTSSTTTTTSSTTTSSTTTSISSTSTTKPTATTSTTKPTTTTTRPSGGGGGGTPSTTSTTVAGTTTTTVPTRITFTDVMPKEWFYSYVVTLSTRGIIGGYSDHTFRPSANVSRAEFCKMICLAMGWAASPAVKSSFTDMDKDHWAHQYIEAAKARGAINGYPNGTFQPGANITRAEIAKVIAVALKLPSGSSSLSDIDACWAEKYIDSCVKADIARGYPNGTFMPNSRATRAEAAKMVAGCLNNE